MFSWLRSCVRGGLAVALGVDTFAIKISRGRVAFVVQPSPYACCLSTVNTVGAALTAWKTDRNYMTIPSSNSQPAFTTNTPGQFGFRFTNASDTYYGWDSLVIDPDQDNFGQGYKITEAYYNTTSGAAINVGAVPVPEPSSMALLGLGTAGVAAWRARRKVKAATEA